MPAAAPLEGLEAGPVVGDLPLLVQEHFPARFGDVRKRRVRGWVDAVVEVGPADWDKRPDLTVRVRRVVSLSQVPIVVVRGLGTRAHASPSGRRVVELS